MIIKIKQFTFNVESDGQFWNNIENWEVDSFKVLDKFLNKDNSLIDVGAWNGVLSMYGSQLCDFVYSFEPDKNAFNKLSKNIELNNIKNIKLENKGCSLTNGTQTLYIRCEGDSTSSFIDRTMEGYKSKSAIEIDTRRLSEYIKNNKIENIGLIKIDIEGGEIYLLEEMKEYIKEYSPNIFISFHPGWFTEKDKNINDMMEVLSNYKHIYNILLEEITKEQAIKGLYEKSHCLIFSNIKI